MIEYKIKLGGEQKGFNSGGIHATNGIYPSSKMIKMSGIKAFKAIKKSLELQYGVQNVIQSIDGDYTTLKVNV